MIQHPSIEALELSSRATDVLKILSVVSIELSGSRVVKCLLALWSRQGLIVKRRPKVAEMEPFFEELIKHQLISGDTRSSQYRVMRHLRGLIVRSLYQSGELERVIDATRSEASAERSYRSYYYHDEPKRSCELQLEILKGSLRPEVISAEFKQADAYHGRPRRAMEALQVLVTGPYDDHWRATLSPRARAIGLESAPFTSAEMIGDPEHVQGLLILNEEGELTPALLTRLRLLSVMSGDDYGLDWSSLDQRSLSLDHLLVSSWAELMTLGVQSEVIERYRERLQRWRKLHRKRTALPHRLEVLWLLLAELTLATSEEIRALHKPIKTLSEHDGDHAEERDLLYRIAGWKLSARPRPIVDLTLDDPLALCFTLVATAWFDLTAVKSPVLLKRLSELRSSGLKRLALEAYGALKSSGLSPKSRGAHVNRELRELKAELGLERAMFESYEPLPAWREQLLSIEQVCSEGGASSPAVSRGKSKERLAWLLSFYQDELSVECRHQIKKPDGWSKGRKISLKRLLLERETFPFLTQQDQEICSHIKQISSGYGWNSSTIYELARSGLVPMIGHPHVFKARAQKRIKVERGVPSVEVKAGGSPAGEAQRWHLSFRPQLERSAPLIYEERGSKLIVYELNATQRAICTRAEPIEVPASGASALRSTLSRISAHFTVHSELPMIEELSRDSRGDLSGDSSDHVGRDSSGGGADSSTMGTPAREDVVARAVTQRDLEPKMTLRVRRDQDQLTLSCHLMIPESTLELTPGEGMPLVTSRGEAGDVIYRRDLDRERVLIEELSALLGQHADPQDELWVTRGIEESFNLLSALQARDEVIEWPEGEHLKVKRLAADRALSFNISASSQRAWFELKGSLSVDEGSVLDLTDLLRGLRGHEGRFVRLSHDQLIELTEEMSAQLRRLDALVVDGGEGELKAHMALADGLSTLTHELSGGAVTSPDRWLKLATRSREAHAKKRYKPRGFKAELRSYQRVGFEWLSALMDIGLGACLADDMGLGKTVQVIALLCQRRADGASLVVAPTSLLDHWRSEIERFAPELKPVIFNDADDRDALIRSMRSKSGAKRVLITSYGLLVQACERFTEQRWNLVVFDEAQALKNYETKRYQAASQLEAKGRIALSGTPIENRLSELWSLFSILVPELLGDRARFKERFETPIERAEETSGGMSGDHKRARAALRALTQPFILRRLKSDVLKDLPAKTEQTIKPRPSAAEEALYEALRREALCEIEEAQASGKFGHIEVLARLTRLRLAACHPELLRSHFLESPELIERLDELGVSAKHRALRELVSTLREGGHRALIFSQFVSHLKLIRDWLDEEGISYQYLDGSTPTQKRAERVAQFQAGEGDLFLISLRAGGVGLNLTAADYVIHMDPWWNPAVEDQATDRAHRIGQDKPVTVYRLITEGTVEEKILTLHEHKRALAEQLLEGSDTVKRLDLEALIALL